MSQQGRSSSDGKPRRTVAVALEPQCFELRHRELLRGVADYAASRGWRLVLDPYADYAIHGPFAGLIATTRKGRGPRLVRSPAPVVLTSWGHVHQPGLVRVLDNRYAAGRLAAEHLVAQGCRTFAYVGFSKQRQSSLEREEFTYQLRRRHLEPQRARTFVTYASSRGWWDKVMRSLGQWLGRLAPPAGVLVARPDFARAVADLARDRGLRVPEDIALVAADDDPVLCELPPALTALRFDYAELGRRAAAVLEGLMAGEPPPERNVLVAPTLVPRLSTDRRAAGDPLVARALGWIERHACEPIGPREVAEALGASHRSLSRRLRAAGRGTLQEEILLARLEEARLRLEGSAAPVAAVAMESGFGSYTAMLRAFRRHLGTTPGAVRRRASGHGP
ncbi:MAG: substrate-binding domain-containing protein [Candidatus Brocadiia bacterium]